MITVEPPLEGYLREKFAEGEPKSRTSIMLVDGVLFDITDPSTWVFNIKTIARSLSNVCRFNGHIENFYSVAEHAVRVSKLLEEWGHGDVVQFLGLHHDDIESIIGDIPAPQKRLFYVDGEPYTFLEKTLEYAYFSTFSFYRNYSEPELDNLWAIVKRADLAVYLEERADRPRPGLGLTPNEAYSRYLERHNSLSDWLFLPVEQIE